ncbi:PBECR3 domain-containing polyvalent protein [Aquariibacter albus]|uniref:Phage-Barnase-EndoU-ColicinE5/D-RelE like nuclease 3 domain-containing protein n=1 Tax=Aquariibacter albus TaxID=2759899 RepID=A0A839HI17_9BURK|nr:hypothetical protein [Aquariibacter albus]MBB1161473.1 hypothetical protein [Aquariibacter albus]
MVLPDGAAAALAARHGRLIATLAQAQFVRMLGLIRGGTEAREAIAQAQTGFSGAFFEQLSVAFSELLQRAVGVAEVKALPVGPISLSRRLYLNDVQTQAETLALVRQHAQGLHQARTLALRLYDGYDPATAAERPLEGRARAELPKALRALTADPVTRESLQALIKRGQAQVARLTSSALRAAYSEAFDAWAAGQGDAALTRRLDVAWREKNRFMAERIAQTELARAHQAQRAQELMADDSIEVVQVVLNPRHPKADICDLHGRANLWGLGPGCYPKERAPRPPFHPFCWCVLRSRPDLEASDARRAAGGEGAFLRSLPEGEAARVMGSKARAMAVMSGASVESVINHERVPEMYRLARLGDAAGGHALVGPAENAVAMTTASASLKDIRAFAVEAMKVADRRTEIKLGKVINAELIQRKTGFDLSGFERMLDNYGVRHTMKQHGSPSKEATRGQIAVTLEDFGLIPLITAEPDDVFADGKNKIGRDVIVFTKVIDGIGYRHVEEIRGKNKLVATDSMRKKKGAWGS